MIADCTEMGQEVTKSEYFSINTEISNEKSVPKVSPSETFHQELRNLYLDSQVKQQDELNAYLSSTNFDFEKFVAESVEQLKKESRQYASE